jgi:DNA-binding NarL/FixJ family response regulator
MLHAMGRAVRVIVVEDHSRTRRELVGALSADARTEVAGESATGDGGVALAEKVQPDVAVVDLGLPDLSGAVVLERIARAAPACRSLALTVCDDPARVLEAVLAGASGYLLKDAPVEEIVDAVVELAGGRAPVSSRVAGALLERVRSVAARPPRVPLTRRESDVLAYFVEGFTYQEVAVALGVSPLTVHGYAKSLYEKLDVTSKAEAAAWAARNGYGRA